jgi:hypothetical protein
VNTATPTVVPILSMPFGVVPLPAAEVLNPALLNLFTAHAGAQGVAAMAAHRFRSQDDLFLWAQPPVRQLAEEMSRGLCSVVLAVNEFSQDDLQSFSLEARAWFTIIEQDGCVAAGNHPLTAWCAVYCVAAPEASSNRADSGTLRIYESRFGSMFHDPTTASMRPPYRAGHYGWRPVPGQMAVFPAAATHEIATLRAGGQLVLVTARFRFTAPGQPGIGRW